MAQVICLGCFGAGSYTSTERVPNPAGGMYREITVRKSCFFCGGIGSISRPESYSPPPSSHASQRQAPKHAPPIQFEEGVATLAAFGAWATIWYYGSSLTNLEWYWPGIVGALIGLLIRKLLAGPFRCILTWLKYVLMIGLVLTGLWMLYTIATTLSANR